jgi:hypothetical protein
MTVSLSVSASASAQNSVVVPVSMNNVSPGSITVTSFSAMTCFAAASSLILS